MPRLQTRLDKILRTAVNCGDCTEQEAHCIDALVLYHVGSEVPDDIADDFDALMTPID